MRVTTGSPSCASSSVLSRNLSDYKVLYGEKCGSLIEKITLEYLNFTHGFLV